MRRYWDASAIVDALHDARIEKLALQADQWTRPHVLSEVFSTLTGGRLGFQYVPSDAASLVREITAKMRFVELNAHETQAALDEAEQRGVRGRIHDWLHARAAQKARVAQLLTDNIADFDALKTGFPFSHHENLHAQGLLPKSKAALRMEKESPPAKTRKSSLPSSLIHLVGKLQRSPASTSQFSA
jgi:hypothetical protein